MIVILFFRFRTESQKATGLRMVYFWLDPKMGISCSIQKPPHQSPYSVCCFYWGQMKSYFFTGIDCIRLIEALTFKSYSLEQKNRIRRNLEGFHPLTVMGSKPICQDIFQLIMTVTKPRPKNFDRGIKVFPWEVLAIALIKIMAKYGTAEVSPELLVTIKEETRLVRENLPQHVILFHSQFQIPLSEPNESKHAANHHEHKNPPREHAPKIKEEPMIKEEFIKFENDPNGYPANWFPRFSTFIPSHKLDPTKSIQSRTSSPSQPSLKSTTSSSSPTDTSSHNLLRQQHQQHQQQQQQQNQSHHLAFSNFNNIHGIPVLPHLDALLTRPKEAETNRGSPPGNPLPPLNQFMAFPYYPPHFFPPPAHAHAPPTAATATNPTNSTPVDLISYPYYPPFPPFSPLFQPPLPGLSQMKEERKDK